MLEKINLFPKTKIVWEKRVRVRRLIQAASIAILILYFLFLSSVLSYSLFISNKEKAVARKIKTFEGQIKSLKSIELKQVFVKTKLKDLVKVFKSERNPNKDLAYLETLIVPGVKFVTINHEGEKIKIRGDAENVLVLDKFVQHLKSKGETAFSQVLFKNINRVDSGDYTFNLSLTK